MRAFTKSDVSAKLFTMVFHRKILLTVLLSMSALLLFAACDDSASGEEKIDQIVAAETGSAEMKVYLWNKWSENFIVPETWVRSARPYSEDNPDGYKKTEAIFNTYQQNWQGKQLYLAHNFRDEGGNLMYEDIIFFFDNKFSNSDVYYIYYNLLPLRDEPPETDD